jgi:hypothetical protein
MMRTMTRSFLVAAMLVAAAATFTQAQTAVNPSGHWEGTIQVPDMPVKVEIDLATNSKGELAGTFTQTDRLNGLPLTNLAIDNQAVTFQIKGSPAGERLFKGDVSADGLSMTGKFAQAGYSIPFSLTRTGDAKIAAPAKSAQIGKALEGTWNGMLEVNGVRRQLVLTLANQPDGTSTGTFLNVEEGLEIPIAAITQAASRVTLEIKAVAGAYAGALNGEGTELTGTLTQGSATLPLTFRKQ